MDADLEGPGPPASPLSSKREQVPPLHRTAAASNRRLRKIFSKGFAMKGVVLAALCAMMPLTLPCAAEPAPREPYGIGLEGFAYPYPVSMLPLVNDGEQVRMAYMDIAPTTPNGRTVVLLHGRNFPSSYWTPVIKTLSEAGYRVVVPDQIGFGKSSKPAADLHFDTLARNTIALLDHLS